jgi:hypothetical protein
MALLGASLSLQAQTGPFSPTNWPPTIDTNAVVDYLIVDPNAAFNTPPAWQPNISFSGGGDQAFAIATRAGLSGDESTSAFMNIADANYAQFASTPVVDILLQVYGNDNLYNADGTGRTVTFREGALGTENPVSGGVVPPGANNGHWNWILFRITNAVNPHVQNTTGMRYIGFVPTPAPPGTQNGGVNGGTLRVEGVAGITIRAVAMGPQGAFGTTNVINAIFEPPVVCSPEPAVNLAFIDINASVTNHLVVLNNLDQTVTNQNSVGPAGDHRKAVQATSTYMNFGISSNYLGQPCNNSRPMKVCVEFYDDPLLAGVSFGPEMYAVDNTGATATYTGPLFTLTGSDKWVKVAFWIPSVNLTGVNATPFTGGPRLVFNGGFPFIDRVELGVVRSGTNALAGLDPDPAYFIEPRICTTNYAYYAELDLQNNIKNGLDVGSSGGDQNMVVEMAGPANDQRLSIRPDQGNPNLQFQILNQVFGPSYQDNTRASIRMTYYDDPALVGASLRPQVYRTYVNGVSQIIGPPAPYNTRVTLTGTGKWLEAYFELPNVDFEGVNQGPQSLVRFQTTRAVATNSDSGNVHVSRVRYDIVRPCGPYLGINMLQNIGIKMKSNQPSVTWFGSGTLRAASAVTGPYVDTLSVTNISTNSYVPPAAHPAQFFDIKFPPLP